MSYWVACLIVVLSAVAAGAASLVVGRRLSVESRRRHHEIGAPVFLQVGVTLSVLLAFVFSEVWGEYNTAAQAINGECAALHGAAMLASALPKGEGQGLDQAIARYARVVVDSEWPQMATGRQGAVAAGTFHAVLERASTLNLVRPIDVSNQGQILSLLAQAHADRETRIFQAGQALPAPMWVVMIAISLVLVGFVLFAGMDPAGHMLFASAYAGSTVAVLVLVRMLDYPFEGALAIGPGDFVTVIREVTRLGGG